MFDPSKYQLPPIPDGLEVWNTRYRTQTEDWHILTEKGWFYCRTQHVKPENRQWIASFYGPSD